MELLWQGYLAKAGNSNNTWKKRFFRILVPAVNSSLQPRIEYFEDVPKPGKQTTPRGELAVTDITGVCLLMSSPAVPAALEPFVDKSEFVIAGPSKLFLLARGVMWRLGLVADDPGGVDFLPQLERASTRLPRITVRLSGWMQAQGTISWNRRFALLLSSGDLLLFRDASLDHLRRRLTLGEAHGIKPVHPLAPSGSASERRVVRVLEASDEGTELVPGVDGHELVGVCIRHPGIQERQGYVMSVEAVPAEDAFQHYARFRRWVMLLQLAASDARLASSGLSVATLSQTPPPITQYTRTSIESNDAQKQLRVIAESGRARSIVLAAHLASAGFPAELRGALWAACSGAPFLRSTSAPYASLVDRAALAEDRVLGALHRLDYRLTASRGLRLMTRAALAEQGEETAFWTVVALVLGDEPGSALLPGFFYRGGYALYVEACVVLDILGLALPDVVAHMSAYDWLETARKRLLQWLGAAGCEPARYPARVWDAMSVLGRDALVRGCVALIAARKASLLQAYSREDAERELDAALGTDVGDVADEAFSSARATEAAGQARRAQWALLVEAMASHLALARAWTHIAASAQALCEDAVRDANAHQLPRVHAGAVALSRACAVLRGESYEVQAALQREMARAGPFAQFVDPRTATRAQEGRPKVQPPAPSSTMTASTATTTAGNDEAELEALDAPSGAGEALLGALRQLGWVACAEAWTAWTALTRCVWARLRFAFWGAAPATAEQQPESMAAVAAAAAAAAAAGREGDAPDDEEDEQGAFTRLTRGLGRWQRRLLLRAHDDGGGGSDKALSRQSSASALSPAMSPHASGLAVHETMDAARLMAKYRGGALGLVDAMGPPARVALIRYALECDAEAGRLVSVLHCALNLARACDQLAGRVEQTVAGAPRKLDVPLLRGVFPVELGGGAALSSAIDELVERVAAY